MLHAPYERIFLPQPFRDVAVDRQQVRTECRRRGYRLRRVICRYERGIELSVRQSVRQEVGVEGFAPQTSHAEPVGAEDEFWSFD